MHILSSNFNLIESNSNWSKLKSSKVSIDKNFNNFHLHLSNNTLLETNVSFHTIIYLSNNNYKKIFRKIKSLKNILKRFSSKPFFFYFFNDPLLSKKNKNNCLKEIKLSNNLFSNIFIKNFFDCKREKFFNSRNLLYLKFPFDVSTIDFFVDLIYEKIKQLNSKPYKLLILDCDNTLWGGVLDENNNKELLYGDSGNGRLFKKFQLKIKDLKNKGFLLSICSKNNEKKVWNFFKKRKMALQKKDFIFSKINWSEKSENIFNIVKNLGLRFEDCVFIDDNILEIKKVQSRIKKINTIHMKNIVNINKVINNNERFSKFLISKEDKKKYDQYKLREKYYKFVNKKNNKNLNSKDVIKDLKQKIKIINYTNSNLKRAEELFQKTNQFNFSLNRYKNSQLMSLNKNKQYELKMFNLKDKFGDHGIIGAYILKKFDDKIIIVDFLLSCRVLYRFVEQFILSKISKKFQGKEIIIIHNKSMVNSELISKFLTNKIFKLLNRNESKYFYKINLNKKDINETEKLFSH
tara:strand:- start:1662 stop:3221 length:1560 start_codon:yes stop_codon:yes gene_type:complete